MDDSNTIIIKPLKPKKIFLFILIGVILLPLYIYYLKRDPSQHTDVVIFSILWFFLAVSLIKQLFYLSKGKHLYNDLTLKLAPEGFYRGTTLYKWYEIECFGVKRFNSTLISIFSNRRIVYWKYKPSSSNRTIIHSLLRLLSGYDDALRASYEIEPDALAELLNKWKTRYAGQSSEIESGMGLDFKRRLTIKEILFIIPFILIASVIIVAIIVFLVKKNIIH